MDKARALALWTALAEAKLDAHISFSYHENIAPSENYQVSAPLGVGRFGPDKLQRVLAIADEADCDVHIIGQSLLLLPR
jgi:hypothetical protein